ncbi:MAG: tetratricopeptide repeat protein [Candidatus Glassbacteria bacterium]
MNGDHVHRVRELIDEGIRLDLIGEYNSALKRFGEALDLSKACGEDSLTAEAQRRTGHIFSKRGEWSAALDHYTNSLEVAESARDELAVAYAMCAMGTVHLERGEWEKVKSCYEKALQIATARQEHKLRAQLFNNLGAMYNILGEWKEAICCYEKSIPLLRTMRNLRGLAETYNNIGMTYRDKDDLPTANRYFKKSLEMARSTGDIRLTATINLNRAEASLKLNELEEARERCEEAFEILNRIKDKLGIAEALKLYGIIYREMQKYSLSLYHLNESVRINTECHNPLGVAESLREEGLLYQARGDSKEALAALGKSFQAFRDLKARKYLEDVDKKIYELEEIYFNIAQSMGEAVESKDTYTYGHSQRVASYAMELAEQLDLDEEQKKTILLAAFLHDLGKVKVPKRILSKPDRLTEEEFAEIKKHPGWGLEKLANIDFPWEVKPLIIHHHERYNGQGYPEGLAGVEIPFGARLIALCDFFDALTTDRPYRPALSIKQAISIMKKEAGQILDPGLTPLFVRIIENKVKDATPNGGEDYEEFISLWNKSAAKRMKGFEGGKNLKITGLAS